MRQLLSIMLLFYGYRYIYRGNFWRFCIVVAAAMCFHITAIIAIPFYFILRQRFKFSYFFVMAVTLIMISMVAQPLLDILIATFYPRYMGTNTMYLFVKPFDIYAAYRPISNVLWTGGTDGYGIQGIYQRHYLVCDAEYALLLGAGAVSHFSLFEYCQRNFHSSFT